MRVPISINNDGCSLFVGTSGFSYPEWIDSGFYPKGTKSGHMLALYSRFFPVVELNYTWYQMVRIDAVERMLARVPDTFCFTAKLTGTMTHEVADSWRSQAKMYLHGITPLLSSNRLLAVLVQFPSSFQRTMKNRQYLDRLLDQLQDLPLAVEFRHRSWAHERVFSGLQERQVTLVAVDAPVLPDLFPPLDVITNPALFYLRLHGRNGKGWRSGSMEEQFNYNYTEQELRWWTEKKIPAMAEQCRRGVLLFNNHVAGQAVQNARSIADLLGRQSS